MGSSVNADRGARPSARGERAAATRRRMIEAAYTEFSNRGYGKTTLESIARAAGVAVQTIYFTFHTKIELLQAAYEWSVLGPDGVPPHLSDWWQRAEAERDVRKAVGHIVEGSMTVFERAAPLVWAVHGDEDARSIYEFNEQLRIDGYARMISFLARKHPLRQGVGRSKARDIVLTLLGPHVFLLMTRELGWSKRQFSRWVHAAILSEVFDLNT
jgi:AcrR family transcriptional regulator